MTRALAILALVAALAACSGPAPRPTPAATAAAAAESLFESPSIADSDPGRLAEILDLPAGDSEDPGPGLRNALNALRGHTTIEVTGEEALSTDATAVIVRAGLPGGGSSTWEVHAARLADGSWRVRWFGGPEASWPEGRSRVDDGLTVSSPPDGISRGR